MSDIYEKLCAVLWELYRKVVPANNNITSRRKNRLIIWEGKQWYVMEIGVKIMMNTKKWHS